MTEDLYQTVGRIEGKLDSLISAVTIYQTSHEREHVQLDKHVADLQADVNKAKGAKWVVGVLAGLVAAGVSLAKDLFNRAS